MGHEGDPDATAVEIALEVQQMRLDRSVRTANRRTNADVRNPSSEWAVGAIIRSALHRHCVDTVRRQDLDDTFHVGGWKSERTAARIAVRNQTRDGVRAAEDSANLIEVASRYRIAGAGAGERTARVARNLVNTHLESELAAQLAKQREIAGALRAKTKVLPREDNLGLQCLGDEPSGKAFRRPRGERRIELANVDALDAKSVHQLDTVVK